MLFSLLFVTTNFANKYVLSILKFTYPTIFQGWQTLVGVVMFRALVSTGHLDGLLHGKEWHECALWLPGMMFFLISIYSGSKALATLPIPVFLSMQNMSLVFRATADLIGYRKIVSVYTYVMMMMTLASALAIAKTDPQFEPDGYLWICVHIVSLGVFEIYTNLMKGRLKLRPTERLFCCYFYSVIVLAPCSYFLGDALEAATFPYLYFGQFYVGCILSGVLGMLMNLCAIRLHEANSSHSFLDISTVQSIAKMFCAATSLAFYDMSFSSTFNLFLIVNMLCTFGFSESSSHWRIQQESQMNHSKSDQNLETSLPWGLDEEIPAGLKRHELQQDMIRVQMS
ncbi:hypothetical protein RRG08_047648 [Elysia crispata]|uniref:Transmembrane protein 241 n=1 Tax=Elysia crispata TaxID=231223 RepID=A0AAE0ZWR2_9GAST|nr:hypothetical protein RRG08_047648 [Elysia crispata]